jgi:hypothetical protein
LSGDPEPYIMTTSTTNLTGNDIRRAFNKTVTSDQHWLTQLAYDSNTGSYTFSPAVSTSYQGGSYSGEWLQIMIPYNIVLTQYSLAPPWSSSANII